MSYRAPAGEFRFLFDHVVNLAQLTATDRYGEATPEMLEAILTGAARLCDGVIAPLKRAGDLHPARLENGVVRCSPGFAEGYAAIRDGGWVALAVGAEHGGMALPVALASAVNDMMSGACLALQLNPLLTQGQIEALQHHASAELRALYLPKLISGEWSGTMNLTEPQAQPLDDGTNAVSGQKIFISWSDGDLTENICHLVLARLPGAPEGTKGISLFLVPKYLPDASGNPGQVNSLKAVSLEHPLSLLLTPGGGGGDPDRGGRAVVSASAADGARPRQ